MWRIIYEFPRYEISSAGRCINTDTDRLLTPQLSGDTWAVYILFRRGARYERQIGRLVAEAFIREPRPGEIVKHLDGDLLNNNVENLYWASKKERGADYKNPEDFDWLLIEELGRVFETCAEVARFLDVTVPYVWEALWKGYKVRGYTLTKMYESQDLHVL